MNVDVGTEVRTRVRKNKTKKKLKSILVYFSEIQLYVKKINMYLFI